MYYRPPVANIINFFITDEYPEEARAFFPEKKFRSVQHFQVIMVRGPLCRRLLPSLKTTVYIREKALAYLFGEFMPKSIIKHKHPK